MERRRFTQNARTLSDDMAPATSRDVREAATHLRRVCPLPLPVEVRMCLRGDADCWGDCDLVGSGPGKRFVIRLVQGMPRAMMEMVLVHEWAHALDWRPEAPFRKDHGPTLGVHWAEVHCEFLGTA